MLMTVSDKVSQFFTTFPLREYRKRELLIRPEEPLQRVFYLVEGRVSEYDVAPSGAEVVVNVFKPGAFFPMSAALNNTRNSYFFEASVKVMVRVAPPDAAVQFLQDNPDIMFDLLKRLYKGMDGVLRRMAHLMGGDARSRLFFELLNAAYRFGELRPDGSILLGLKENDLARHSGLARETVNRHIQALKAADLLEVGKGIIVLKDIKRLEALLGAEL
jgi:CRP/FNR family transcriptional regulator, cyclic AMP receptor protein